MLKHLALATAFLSVASVGASAGIATIPQAAVPQVTRGGIILVSGGCGFAFHRNPFGACVPNRGAFIEGGPVLVPPVRPPPPCPRGYYRDPDPARRLCYPY